ncbi:MAG: serine/threonine-protein kinase [Bacteroidota bacterium]
MPPHDWERLDALLDALLDLTPEERTAYLREHAIDSDLAREALALLEAQGEATDRLGNHVGDVAGELLPVALTVAEHPERVGPYRLVEPLGRGGMGTVFLARRDDGQFEQTVALKLIRRGLDTDDVLRRFRYERQILAGLKHPNIAALLDGGMTDGGQPYFVMEYVEGESITAYASRKGLDTDARLALFRTVCQAVQHAHQNLVIHRDLKPSNILVTEAGEVKLLDFGIARLLDDDGSEAMMTRTVTGQQRLTPAYAAPEQVRGEAVTTATDVYQLGVLLYELLTGVRPFKIDSRVQAEVARVILEEEPTRPSTVVASTETASGQGVDTGRLSRRLAGDVDNIILKALSKESERRYGTADQLGEDVRRHLAGLPVEARAASVGYRVGKFVRRHRAGVAVAAGVALLLITSTVTIALQQRATAAALAEAEQERDASEEVTAFLINLFKGNDPEEARGDTLTAIDLMQRGQERIALNLADQPAMQARLLTAIGTIQYELDQYAESDSALQQALRLYEGLPADQQDRAVDALTMLGNLRIAQGDYVPGDSLYHVAHERRLAMYGAEHRETSIGLMYLGLGQRLMGNAEQATAHLGEALAMIRRTDDTPDDTWLAIYENLGAAQGQGGDYAASAATLRAGIDVGLQLYPDSLRLRIANTMSNLGAALNDLGRNQEAAEVLEASISISERLLGPTHSAVGVTVGNLGMVYQDLGDYEAALRYKQRSLDIEVALNGEESIDVAILTLNLANAHTALDDYATAEVLMQDAQATLSRLLPAPHYLHGAFANNYGDMLFEMADNAGARAAYDRAVATFEDVLPDGHPMMAYPVVGLGRIHLREGQPAEAEPLLRQALQLRLDHVDADSPLVAEAQLELGVSLLRMDQTNEAEPLLTAAVHTFRSQNGVDGANTQRAYEQLAALYDAKNQPRQAAAYRDSLTVDVE